MDKVSATPIPPVPPVLETPTMNITAAQNWIPTLNTPSLKLPTPVLDSADWGVGPNTSITGNANTSGAGGLLSAGVGPGGLGSGMSPRFMLESLRMSPGVSGSIAPNASAHAPKASSSSLAELFIVNEYSNPQNNNNTGAGNNNNGNNGGNNNNAGGNKNPQASMAMPAPGLTVNVSQALPHSQVQQQQGLPPKQPHQQHMPHVSQAMQPPLPVTVSAAHENLPVHSAAGALSRMQQPMNATVPQHPMNSMVAPSNTIPHSQQVGYPHGRSLPMSHVQQVQQQQTIPQPQARYPDMGYPTAMPASLQNTVGATAHQAVHPAAQRLAMHRSQQNNMNHGNLGAGNMAPSRMRAGTGGAGGVVSSAIEEAKQNAQERADKFAQKRKRTRAQSNTTDKAASPPGSGSDEAPGNTNSAGDLKKKRYNRRLELNRQSAAVSRVRRRAYVEELEGKLMFVEREKLNLEDQVTVMTNENGKLRQQMRHLHEQLSNSSRTNANGGFRDGDKQ